MLQEFSANHRRDIADRPAGGTSTAKGITIEWQDGPLGRSGERQLPNGAFVETVIKIAADRLHFYQNSEFKCDENHNAIVSLENALAILHKRTADREAREVEGTHNA